MNSPIAGEREAKERAAFEAWADDQGFPLKRVGLGDDYQDLRTQGPWEAWQARAALLEPVGEGDARDAARYRWLREQEWFEGPLCVLRDPKRVLTQGIGLGADCPSRDRLDTAIDAAIAASPKSKDQP